jgi:signal transduction histidine kinase
MVVLGAPIDTALTLLQVQRGAYGEALMVGLLGATCLTVMAVLRDRLLFGPLAHIICALQVVVNGAQVMTTGQLTNLHWVSALPVIVLFFAGVRPSLVWAGISTLATVVVAAVVSLTHPRPDVVALTFNEWVLLPVLLSLGLTFWTIQQRMLEQLTRARQGAEAASRAKSSFLASMSHEIRTPLNGVLGTTELMLLRQAQLDQATRDDLATIHESGHMLLRLLNELLDLSKVEAGRLEVHGHDFPLDRALREVVGLYQAGARTRGLTLERTTTLPASLTVHGDSVRLRQVLNNLVGNALKFTEAGGVVLRCTGVRGADGRWALTFDVVDTGRGIDASDQERLFEPFTQLNRADSLRGTGLGLPLSRALARAMGGELVAVSNGDQPGACLRLTLTLPEAQPAPEAQAAPLPALPRVNRGRVLVVDDNAINLRVASAMSTRLGFEVDAAHDGAEALAMMAARPYELVLMDCHMPGVDGLEATRRQRAREGRGEAPRLVIIALTASVLAPEVEACKQAGMDEVLSKPLQLRALEDVVSRFAPVA